jgi:hypothetical protein
MFEGMKSTCGVTDMMERKVFAECEKCDEPIYRDNLQDMVYRNDEDSTDNVVFCCQRCKDKWEESVTDSWGEDEAEDIREAEEREYMRDEP